METTRRGVHALQLAWRSPAEGDDRPSDHVVLYWFAGAPSGSDVVRTLEAWGSHVSGSRGVRSLPVSLPATPAETRGWTLAARAYLDEVVAATSDLRSAKQRLRRWSWWPARSWAMAGYREASAAALDRVDAARSAYGPVREALDERLAEQAAADAEAAGREQQREDRRQREAVSRFEAWQRRQAVADSPLSGGRTPRQLAAGGDIPASWPPAVEATVGDVDAWWSGVRASVRNERARAEAVRTVVEAVTAAAAALEGANRPGISDVKEAPRQALRGWWVDFVWSRPGATQLGTPPDIPVDHLWGGTWDFDLYLPDRMLFYVPELERSSVPGAAPVPPDAYCFATVTEERIGNSDYTRPAWWKRDVTQFAEALFPSWITYRVYPQLHGFRTPITDHADPAVFVPYVDAVTQRAVATFQALAPGST